mmetsp:Transcript_8067/g.33742  ORF Transcript_8067/g.33742 Transcript_8067/m.33742 type:complete len:246 (+) Transcript_8067:3132-3869(+)
MSSVRNSSSACLVSASSLEPSAAPTPFTRSAFKNEGTSSGATPANSLFVSSTASFEWNVTHASRLARTFPQARANISLSKHAIARGTGAFKSHRLRCHASKSAVLAPMPLKGLIGCAASPTAVTLEIAFVFVFGRGGSSRSYRGPHHTLSQSVVLNIAGKGSCHVPATVRTNARTDENASARASKSLASARGALASARASASVTRTLICHMLLRITFSSFTSCFITSSSDENGIVNTRARFPSRV